MASIAKVGGNRLAPEALWAFHTKISAARGLAGGLAGLVVCFFDGQLRLNHRCESDRIAA